MSGKFTNILKCLEDVPAFAGLVDALRAQKTRFLLIGMSGAKSRASLAAPSMWISGSIFPFGNKCDP
jgi:hypothetical protein